MRRLLSVIKFLKVTVKTERLLLRVSALSTVGDPFHLPLTGIFYCTLYNKLIVQSTIKNPHKNQTMIFNISYHNFYGLGI